LTKKFIGTHSVGYDLAKILDHIEVILEEIKPVFENIDPEIAEPAIQNLVFLASKMDSHNVDAFFEAVKDVGNDQYIKALTKASG
jgi:hypothetical protein